MKKPLFLLPLVAALCTMSLPAQSADYHVVVPAPGKAASYASIKLELNPASLPLGFVGDSYAGFDFSTALRITGDPELDMSQVSWSRYSGELPDGLTLARDGSLHGTPLRSGTGSFQALAKYKTKTALGTYALDVKAEKQIILQAGVRYWEDGTFAQSCAGYRQPAGPYAYAGATGDGTYRISINGQASFDVHCDMTSQGGGWTLVVSQNELTPVVWTGAQSGNSFSLPSQQIPAHTQVAFGRSDLPVLDYVNWTYSTGNIDKILLTSPASGKSYWAHRNELKNYSAHAPDYSPGDHEAAVPPVPNFWANTLTFDLNDDLMSLTWAFSPNWTQAGRGYSFNGEDLWPLNNTEDWLVWVR